MSLVATLVQESRVRSELDRFELMIEEAGCHDTFRRQSESAGSIVSDTLRENAFTSAGNTVKVPVLNYKDVTVRSTLPLVIPADENTSAFYTVTWTQVAYGFHMYRAQHYNNEIDYQQDFDHKFKAMMRKFIQTIEGLANTALNNAKTQVMVTPTPGGHAFASNVVSETGTGSLKDSYILHDLGPMQATNDFYDSSMDVIGNQYFRSILNRMEGFGVYNQENKTLPFGNKMFHFSNQIANAVGKNATGYAVADGSLGLLKRVEPDAVLRTRLGTSHEWDIVDLPIIGPVGTYRYDAAVDASAVAGAATAHLTRTGQEAFDFAFEIAHITPYNSDPATIASPIVKFDVATA